MGPYKLLLYGGNARICSMNNVSFSRLCSISCYPALSAASCFTSSLSESPIGRALFVLGLFHGLSSARDVVRQDDVFTRLMGISMTNGDHDLCAHA